MPLANFIEKLIYIAYITCSDYFIDWWFVLKTIYKSDSKITLLINNITISQLLINNYILFQQGLIKKLPQRIKELIKSKNV